ncbi:MAG: kdpA [Dehalococcoidia bacterium]|nr:kdpA [Dehalococcoidia bacterium]
MTTSGWIQITIYMVVLLLLVRPLGSYMARVYEGERSFVTPLLGPLERFLYRLGRSFGLRPDAEMEWGSYAIAVLLFNFLGFVFVFGVERLQQFLPGNPQHLTNVSPDLAFNTAVSFISNTNWQSYAGESTMSYLTQMLALTSQNFLSAATGMAVLAAVIRGFARQSASTLGNFWADVLRSVVYILLPLSVVFAILLVSQGVVQTLSAPHTVQLVQPTVDASGQTVTQQTIAVGPVASQEAIKMLGTNGGGFFNVNSAHPFENPTPLTNFLELLAILLIPAALCYTFGSMVKDTRKGWAILAAMVAMFVILLGVTVWAEQTGNPSMAALGVDTAPGDLQAGGNMEGKEVRFGITNSALWATATTAASSGSVNSMHDSFMPLGGMVPMWLMQLGEVVFGGAGSGLYGMLAFVIIAVFVAGLIVGRTPEYLGKKIEAYEMKMASIMVLVPVVVVLIGAAIAVVIPAGVRAVSNPGAHGFSEILYAFSSAGNNNGSAFAGLGSNNFFYNLALGLAMLFGRYWSAIPALAIAGSLVRKKKAPEGAGTLPAQGPLFVIWLISVVVIVGALSFFPALALGPIVEHLQLR